MMRLPTLSSKQVMKALRAAGFKDAPKRGKGSHIALVKHDGDVTRLVIIPDRKFLPKGTLRAISEQSGLNRDKFLKLLNMK